MQPYLSVIIPVYNEEKRINGTFQQLESYFKHIKYNYEVILVNDGSSDKTATMIYNKIKGNKKFQLIDNKINRGKGYSIKRGVKNAQGENILFTDADFSTPLVWLDKLISYINDYPIVIGSRYLESDSIKVKQPIFRRIISRGGNLVVKLVLGLSYQDTQCGFKLLTSEVAKRIFDHLTIGRWGFDLEMLCIAKQFKIPVKEVAVDWYDDKNSQLRAGKDAFGTIKELLIIRKNIINNVYK